MNPGDETQQDASRNPALSGFCRLLANILRRRQADPILRPDAQDIPIQARPKIAHTPAE